MLLTFKFKNIYSVWIFFDANFTLNDKYYHNYFIIQNSYIQIEISVGSRTFHIIFTLSSLLVLLPCHNNVSWCTSKQKNCKTIHNNECLVYKYYNIFTSDNAFLYKCGIDMEKNAKFIYLIFLQSPNITLAIFVSWVGRIHLKLPRNPLRELVDVNT